MVADAAPLAPLWPLAVYFGAVIIMVTGMIALAFFLGEHHHDRATGQPYESGMISTGPTRVRFPLEFYQVAMFFVVFDLESVFIYAWAVALRELGWAGYAEVLVFVSVLVAGLVYLWRLGALDWGTAARRKKRQASRDAKGSDMACAERGRQGMGDG